jgi:pilus assembly protein Flp/PilA
MTRVTDMFRAFAREEDGVALSEYLILLGLLVGGVILAVTTAGENLSTAWEGWGTFFLSLDDAAPAAGGGGTTP